MEQKYLVVYQGRKIILTKSQVLALQKRIKQAQQRQTTQQQPQQQIRQGVLKIGKRSFY